MSKTTSTNLVPTSAAPAPAPAVLSDSTGLVVSHVVTPVTAATPAAPTLTTWQKFVLCCSSEVAALAPQISALLVLGDGALKGLIHSLVQSNKKVQPAMATAIDNLSDTAIDATAKSLATTLQNYLTQKGIVADPLMLEAMQVAAASGFIHGVAAQINSSAATAVADTIEGSIASGGGVASLAGVTAAIDHAESHA